MFRRFSFIVTFGLLLSTLAWFSQRTPLGSSEAAPALRTVARATSPENSTPQTSRRRELLETLDRVVVHQRYYRSLNGHFTQLLSRIGYRIPTDLISTYDIRVTQASPDKLVITAFSEERGRVKDLVTVDQDFGVQANFPIPTPRPDYLKLRAMRHLRLLKEAPERQVLEEQTLFRDFFRYEVRRDSEDRRVAYAVGVRAPVIGVQLESGPQDWAQDEIFIDDAQPDALVGWVEGMPEIEMPLTGQHAMGNQEVPTDQAEHAQKKFKGDLGLYARSWSQLSKITRFKMNRSIALGVESLPFADVPQRQKLDVPPPAAPGAAPLEIEPIE